MPNTFADYRYHPQPALGRTKILERLVRDLRTRHINLVGPRSTGKSCLARAVFQDPSLRQSYQAVVFCDLKSRAPDGDDEFFRMLKSELFQQLPDEVSKMFLDPKAEIDDQEALAESAQAWHEAGVKVLVILDGIDDAFLSLDDGWDFLCGFVDKLSVRMLVTSRRRIRELANSRKKIGSNMHERFRNPADLPPLDMTDIEAIAHLGGEVSAGALAALQDWTGGNAGLLIALCEEAANLNPDGGSLSVDGINEAAKTMLVNHCEELDLAWDDLQPDERDLFITACRVGEVPVAQGNGARLQRLGFAMVANGQLKPQCRLMAEFGGRAAGAEALFKDWFGNEAAFLPSMKHVLSLRLGSALDNEPNLIRNVRDAIEAIERPDKAARAFRDIVKEALDLVWDVETPNREVPYFTKGGGPNWLVGARSWPRDNKGFSDLLDLMTHDKYWASAPKRLNRKIFSMISFLIHAGDFKNHQNDQIMTPGFLISAVTTAVELVGEMKLAGLL